MRQGGGEGGGIVARRTCKGDAALPRARLRAALDGTQGICERGGEALADGCAGQALSDHPGGVAREEGARLDADAHGGVATPVPGGGEKGNAGLALRHGAEAEAGHAPRVQGGNLFDAAGNGATPLRWGRTVWRRSTAAGQFGCRVPR